MSSKTSIHDMPIVYPDDYDPQRDGWSTHHHRPSLPEFGLYGSARKDPTKIVGDDTFHPTNASSGVDYLFTDEYLNRIECGELA